ncbi:TetR/AcrR family transcriptional regulator [Butyrivibrio sp. NC3005]|uniref:TetR/AcrR family transcriptional regulator n=1 Tax=Butyrivibrio sp. NC3005 TaxID=1280685 RepID=UPI0004045818|nr:TetR/AcrR family transcriptional regulator [Butyrivibrio sp. NC3005]
MGAKSDRKRNYIIEKSRNVFARKGFKNVTMKDLVEECNISRGGLYLHFSSTEQIFMAVLSSLVKKDSDAAIEQALMGNASASDMLVLFLNEQKKEILCRDNNLGLAIYEYCASHSLIPKNNLIKKSFDTSVGIIEGLIDDGVRDGEFVCEDAHSKAVSICYILEGLRYLSDTVGLTEENFDSEINYILAGLAPVGVVSN